MQHSWQSSEESPQTELPHSVTEGNGCNWVCYVIAVKERKLALLQLHGNNTPFRGNVASLLRYVKISIKFPIVFSETPVIDLLPLLGHGINIKLPVGINLLPEIIFIDFQWE
jgi:hypothetical protein